MNCLTALSDRQESSGAKGSGVCSRLALRILQMNLGREALDVSNCLICMSDIKQEANAFWESKY